MRMKKKKEIRKNSRYFLNRKKKKRDISVGGIFSKVREENETIISLKFDKVYRIVFFCA